MNYEWLKLAGAVAGIGGVAIACVAYIFREIIRKEIFPQLKPKQAYALLNRIITLIFIVGLLGVLAYLIVSLRNDGIPRETTPSPTPTASAENENAVYTFPGKTCKTYPYFHNETKARNEPMWWRKTGEISIESDDPSVVKSFYLCTYDLPVSTRRIVIHFAGATVNFSTKTGTGGGLVLAVYDQPTNLNITDWSSYGYPEAVFKEWKRWSRQNANDKGELDIKPQKFDIVFESGKTQIGIAVTLVDSWDDSNVKMSVKNFTFESLN